MPSAFDAFVDQARLVAPRAALVLGSGLGEVAAHFRASAVVSYADIPDFVPPSVQGHKGQMAVGHWNETSALVCFGRVHFYEGHPWSRVTRLVELAADLGARTLVLTNAAGGIRASLNPGDLMAIHGHLTLLKSQAWRTLTVTECYDPDLLKALHRLDPGLPAGVYAALTGPCYETPAEIRALAAIGADAVGMSTAREAEAGIARGMRIAGISCITNKAAGLSEGALSHHEVEITAKTAADRLRSLLDGLFAAV